MVVMAGGGAEVCGIGDSGVGGGHGDAYGVGTGCGGAGAGGSRGASAGVVVRGAACGAYSFIPLFVGCCLFYLFICLLFVLFICLFVCLFIFLRPCSRYLWRRKYNSNRILERLQRQRLPQRWRLLQMVNFFAIHR